MDTKEEVEKLRLADNALINEMEDFVEEHKKVMHALNAAFAAGRDGLAETAEANDSEAKLKALKERKIASGVSLAKCREILRLEQLKVNDDRRRDIASQAEPLADKIREQLQSAGSSAKKLRSLCNEYVGLLPGEDRGVEVMVRPWVEVPEAIDRAFNPLPSQVFGKPKSIKLDFHAWTNRMMQYAK